VGAGPTGELQSLMASTSGVKYLGEVDSIPDALTAASIAVNRLMGDYRRCMRVIDSGESWVSSIIEQMNDPQRVRENGQNARDWVIDCHSWGPSAKIAIDSLQ
jgi:hypothetical protein